MKKFVLLSMMLLFSAVSIPSFSAVVVVQPQTDDAVNAADAVAAPGFSMDDFVGMTPRQFEERSGKKLSWTQKIAFKMVQKKVKKNIAKGKVDASAPASGNTMSLLSLIGGVGGFLFIWLPGIGILGLLMAVAGFVLGIVASKKEGSNVMNLLGIIFGALTILLFILAVIVVASFLSVV